VAAPKPETPAALASGATSAAAAPRASAAQRASAPAPKAEADGQRAQALLEGKDAQPARASEPGATRVVVQVGAYTDSDKLRAARQKVEQMGMKTYTQVVEVEGTSRTRVRIGPFATRQEAEQAASRLRAAGLPAAILVL
jgi:DedD protein